MSIYLILNDGRPPEIEFILLHLEISEVLLMISHLLIVCELCWCHNTKIYTLNLSNAFHVC